MPMTMVIVLGMFVATLMSLAVYIWLVAGKSTIAQQRDEIKLLQSAMATPECYAGVITDVVERELDFVRAINQKQFMVIDKQESVIKQQRLLIDNLYEENKRLHHGVDYINGVPTLRREWERLMSEYDNTEG
jgi:hypothetical protein